MCGLAGLILTHANGPICLRSAVLKMINPISHRGPDATGVWIDESFGFGFGHKRLAILDPSHSGAQPMLSHSGRYVLVFNGEIYNHQELRKLVGLRQTTVRWIGQSDTESLLTAIEILGLEEALKAAVGMFALALFDVKNRVVFLARDRFGEKPLYYGWVNGAFVFGSELKALRAAPDFKNPVCRQALGQYLRHMYVPAPRSIYQGVFKLTPGCILKVSGRAPSAPPPVAVRPGLPYETVEISSWWSLQSIVNAGVRTELADESSSLAALEKRLLDSVLGQTISDVPIGAFLSGGIDSSMVVALMQSKCAMPVRTFTVGFEESDFDESTYARAVAIHLGTDHNELRVSPIMAQDVIPLLPMIYDEPFADSSQIPTFLISKFTRQQVTVALSGDGGDELFGGYYRYFWGDRIWNHFSRLPPTMRKHLGRLMNQCPAKLWNLLGNSIGISHLSDKASRLGLRLESIKTESDLYWSLVSEWNSVGVVRGLDHVSRSEWEESNTELTRLQPVERMMFWDSVTYLTDDIMCKVDRAAMACSLEVRAPFLDHRVAEFAWNLPLDMKVRNGAGKWALRQILYKYIPKHLVDRPKAGFGVPVGRWLRGPLREWAEGLLNESRIRREGYFNHEPIRKVWTEHLSGISDHTPKIWSILMFQAWLEAQEDKEY
jgi:asparagine synthase (glutamine-hydrolysing)